MPPYSRRRPVLNGEIMQTRTPSSYAIDAKLVIAAVFFAASSLLLAAPPAQAKELPDFTELADKFGPPVVNVSTKAPLPGHGQRTIDETVPMYEFLKHL